MISFNDEISALYRLVDALEGMPPDVVERMMIYLASRFAPKNWKGRPMVRGDIQ